MRHESVKRVVDAAGGPTALARALGIKMESTYSWRRIPATRVIDIEKITGIHRSELRPDIYPPEERAA
jgi:DNA-binding transcriptional regulator YdaS (Cro superfamily)